MSIAYSNVAAYGAITVAAVGLGAALQLYARRRKVSVWTLSWPQLPTSLRVALALVLLLHCYVAFFRLSKQVEQAQVVHDITRYSVDIEHYEDATLRIDRGEVPWRDFFFEYPPTAAYLVSVPGLGQGQLTRGIYTQRYIRYIGLLLALGTVLVGGLWLYYARTAATGLALATWIYSVAFLGELTFLRMEPIIALLSLGGLSALFLISGERRSPVTFLVSGLLLGLAAAKLYPILLILPMLPWIYARRGLTPFASGVFLTSLPSILPAILGLANTTKFLNYHGQRHMEIGSLYAVLNQFAAGGHTDLGFGSVQWRFDSENVVAKIATLLTLIATLFPLILIYWKRRDDRVAAYWAALASLSGFIFFNKVGSPQYVTWLLSALVCGAILEMPSRALRGWLLSLFLVYLYAQGANHQMANFTFDDGGRKALSAITVKVTIEGLLYIAILATFFSSLRRDHQPKSESVPIPLEATV